MHGESALPATLQSVMRRARARVRRWVMGDHFHGLDPSRSGWRRPGVGYAAAVALPATAALGTIGLAHAFPMFAFPEALVIVAIALVALAWGAGPSLAAALAGTALLEGAVLPSISAAGGIEDTTDLLQIGACLAGGGVISVLASGAERARRRSLEESAAARARELALRETNTRMDAFLGVASHELRNPLHNLGMALYLAQARLARLMGGEGPEADEPSQPEDALPVRGDAGAELAAVSQLLTTAERQVQRQERLVGDLVDVERIRAGILELRPAMTDLTALVREALEEQRLAWPDRTLVLDVLPGLLPAEVDAHRVGQVLMNLLTNALTYSPTDRPVAVRLEVTDGFAVISVHDEGPGLTSEQQARVWERFYRVPGTGSRGAEGNAAQGLGLGLHICRELVERHGGRVGVESAPGHGSTFWFTLPRTRPGA